MPNFLVYALAATVVMIPVFLANTFIFFRPS
jgi:hypothetical protein